jgi:hypothetical protein
MIKFNHHSLPHVQCMYLYSPARTEDVMVEPHQTLESAGVHLRESIGLALHFATSK